MSWQERINREVRIQKDREEEARRKRDEAAREARLVAESRIHRIDVVFGLLDSLNIRKLLEEIRQDVWKDGQVKGFERSFTREHQPPRGREKHGYPEYQACETIRGMALEYPYKEPTRSSEYVDVRKFGFYQGRRQDAVLIWEDRTARLAVAVRHREYSYWFSNPDPNEFDLVIESESGLAVEHPLYPDSLDLLSLNNLIDKALLNNSVNRTRGRELPAQIREDMHKRLVEVEKEIGEYNSIPESSRLHKPSKRLPSEGGGMYYEGPCLPGYALISTPMGLIPIKNLKVGDFAWTVDKFGSRKEARIIQKVSRVVPKNHKIAHLILEDGRKLFVSAYHPTITGEPIISLKRGQLFNDSLVSSITIIPYKGKYTYDILPEGDTGGYWANNMLLGSTLLDKFESIHYITNV